MRTTTVLISGEQTGLCDNIRRMLSAESNLDVSSKIRLNGELLGGNAARPDILVLLLDPPGDDMLQTLARLDPAQRPLTVVVGPSNNPKLMRSAIQVGVRDYLTLPLVQAELIEAVQRLARESGPSSKDSLRGQMYGVIDVKGGSGASFLAATMAHMIAIERKIEVGLLDLDLQFGALPLAFDLHQRTTLTEALAAAKQLDESALRGYMARHKSGVHVLSAMADPLVMPWEISEDAVVRLLEVMRETFPVVVVDLPRQIDPLTSSVLTQASRVLMVMQQSLAHARDAKRMQRVLTTTLGLPRDRLLLVLNRFAESQSVRESDVQEAVNPHEIAVLPNDFKTVSDAMNGGVPLFEHDPGSPIAKAVGNLLTTLTGRRETDAPRRRGLREVLAQALRA